MLMCGRLAHTFAVYTGKKICGERSHTYTLLPTHRTETHRRRRRRSSHHRLPNIAANGLSKFKNLDCLQINWHETRWVWVCRRCLNTWFYTSTKYLPTNSMRSVARLRLRLKSNSLSGSQYTFDVIGSGEKQKKKQKLLSQKIFRRLSFVCCSFLRLFLLLFSSLFFFSTIKIEINDVASMVVALQLAMDVSWVRVRCLTNRSYCSITQRNTICHYIFLPRVHWLPLNAIS